VTGGEPAARKIWKTVPLVPHDFVDQLDAEELAGKVDDADVVIRPVNPQRAGGTHDALQLGQPRQRELQIILQIHVIPAGHDFRPIAAKAGQSHAVIPLPDVSLAGVVGWIGDRQVNRMLRQL
jgi:hypothetical protein